MSQTKRYLTAFWYSLLVLITALSAAQFVTGCAGVYDGEKLFFRVGCSQCHTYEGRGGRMGPDLSAVANRKSGDWIDSYIQNPRKMNPLSRMPSFSHLSRAKRQAIIKFLQN